MSVTRPVAKTETLKKTKIKPAWVISLPLESGQLKRWYFHLSASNGISVCMVTTIKSMPMCRPMITSSKSKSTIKYVFDKKINKIK